MDSVVEQKRARSHFRHDFTDCKARASVPANHLTATATIL